jgi:hypothetical protein
MKTYEVYLTVSQEWTKIYKIEADSEDQAIQRAQNTDAEPAEEYLDAEDKMCFQTMVTA